MWLVWSVTVLAGGLAATCIILLWEDLRSAPRGWQLMAASGVPLALGGLAFILRFWDPLPGPYLANELYPLGPYVNAWAVSFGFMWLAFGLVFFGFALRAPRTGGSWFILLFTWFLAWLPHGIIGIGFATAGGNQPSIQLYLDWASEWTGLVRLSGSALVLVGHFALAILGFVISGRALLRGPASGAYA